MGRWWCLGPGWCTYKYTHTQTQPVTLACTHQSQRTGEATRTSPHQHDHVSCDTYAGCYIVAMQIISNAIFVCFQQNGEMANDGEWFCDPTRVFAVRACLAAFVSVCVCVWLKFHVVQMKRKLIYIPCMHERIAWRHCCMHIIMQFWRCGENRAAHQNHAREKEWARERERERLVIAPLVNFHSQWLKKDGAK